MRPNGLDRFYRFLSRRGEKFRTITRTAAKRGLRVLSKMRGFEVSADASIHDVHMLLGTYERDTVEVCKRILEPGMVVADIGAHIGFFSRLFAQLVGPTGRVFAFEPHPQNRAVLRRNLRRFRNARVVPAAIADADGKDVLHESAAGTGTYSLTAGRFAETRQLTVRTTTLDRFFEDTPLTMIKVDVEGAEPRVLRGARRLLDRSRVLYLVMEFYPSLLRLAGESPVELLEMIRDAGATISLIAPGGSLEPVERWGTLGEFAAAIPEYVNLLAVKDSRRP